MTIYVLVKRTYDYHKFDQVEFATTDCDELLHKVSEYDLACFLEGAEEYSDEAQHSLWLEETPHLVIKEFAE